MNIWYGADDAPGVIDVDISSTTRTKLDYYNSSEYENDNMRNGKIEYVNVHAYDDFSWKFRLDEVEQDDDDDILAEEDVGSAGQGPWFGSLWSRRSRRCKRHTLRLLFDGHAA